MIEHSWTRRASVAVALATTAVLLASCGSTVDGSGEFGGGSQSGSGRPTGPSDGHDTPKLDLQQMWKRQVGGPSGSSTQLAGGSADAQHVYISGVDGHVVALDAKTGAVAWSKQPGTRTGTPVAVSGNRVFYYDANTGLTVLDAATGATLWHVKVSQAPLGAVDPPVVSGIVAVPTFDHGLAGLRRSSGKQVWAGKDPAQFSGTEPVSNGKLIFDVHAAYQTSKSTLYALAPATGKQVWRADFDTGTMPELNVYALGDVVAVLTQVGESSEENATLTGFDASTGKQLWQIKLTGVSTSEQAYLVDGLGLFDSLHGLLGIDPHTGKTEFTAELDHGAGATGGFGVCAQQPCGIGLDELRVLDDNGEVTTKLDTPGDGAVHLVSGHSGGVYLLVEGTVYRYH